MAVTGRNGDDNNEERCKQIGFSNESQLLLINQLSVEELRDRIRSSDDSSLLEIDQTCDDTQSRFRANLIISASPVLFSFLLFFTFNPTYHLPSN